KSDLGRGCACFWYRRIFDRRTTAAERIAIVARRKAGPAQGQRSKDSEPRNGIGSSSKGACPEFDSAWSAQDKARGKSKDSRVDPTEIDARGARDGAIGSEQGSSGNQDPAACGGAEPVSKSIWGCAQHG